MRTGFWSCLGGVDLPREHELFLKIKHVSVRTDHSPRNKCRMLSVHARILHQLGICKVVQRPKEGRKISFSLVFVGSVVPNSQIRPGSLK